MICPHCQSPQLRKLNQTTDLGYAEFRCGGCRRKSNEPTGTPFNYLELPTDIVFEIVLCRLRYKLSLRNLAEMFLLRGFECKRMTNPSYDRVASQRAGVSWAYSVLVRRAMPGRMSSRYSFTGTPKRRHDSITETIAATFGPA